MSIIDGNSGFKELRLSVAEIGRNSLSSGRHKLTFSLLDVSEALAKELPAALRLLDRHTALLELLGDREQVYLAGGRRRVGSI